MFRIASNPTLKNDTWCISNVATNMQWDDPVSFTEFVKFFMSLSAHLKAYHWVTTVEHIHNALGVLYKQVDDLADDIMEGVLAFYVKNKNTPVPLLPCTVSVSVQDPLEQYLSVQCHALNAWIQVWKEYPHIENYLREIMAHMSKALYKIRLSKI